VLVVVVQVLQVMEMLQLHLLAELADWAAAAQVKADSQQLAAGESFTFFIRR